MNCNNLVSICIPTYNGSKYLKEALDSVKIQTYKNIEIIISDDKSNDDTLLICENFKKEVEFPVYIYSHKPCGIGANWNNCIEKSNGEYIKFLFQDDVLIENCLENQLMILNKYDSLVTCSKRNIIDSNSEFVVTGTWFKNFGNLQKDIEFKDVYMFNSEVIKYLPSLIYNYFGEPDTFLFSKKIFSEIGLFNEHFEQILDIEFSLRILKKYPIIIQNKYLLNFRIHEDQASIRNEKVDLIEYRILGDFIKKNYKLSYRANKEYYLERYPYLNYFFKLKKMLRL